MKILPLTRVTPQLITFIIISLYTVVLAIEGKNYNPLYYNNSQGYPCKKDNIETLLDRIEWSACWPGRINYFTKFLQWSMWLNILLSFVFLDKFPPIQIFFRNWICTALILVCLNGFYYWHSDKFTWYSIIENVKLLRKKLNVSKGDLNKLTREIKNINGHDPLWVFTHIDHSLGTVHPDS